MLVVIGPNVPQMLGLNLAKPGGHSEDIKPVVVEAPPVGAGGVVRLRAPQRLRHAAAGNQRLDLAVGNRRLDRVVEEAELALAAEVAVLHHPSQQSRRTEAVIAELAIQELRHVQNHIEANEIAQG